VGHSKEIIGDIVMLKDKVVLITGASRGIGAATARICAKNHARVIINYNNSYDQAKELRNSLTKEGYDATIFQADISKEEDVKALYNFVKKDYGRIDVLVNNAGIMINNLIMMTKTSEFDQIIDTNCKGVFLCTRQFSKLMMKKGSGKIINIASIVGVYGNRGQTVYSASKSFVIGFSKASAKELGQYGITVNAVAPGFIETDLSAKTDDKTRKELMSNIALKRFGTPEDIAKVVLFLSTDLSDYVSGQVVGVDGCQIM